MKRFTDFFPKYKGLKLYGAVAGIRIEEESDRYADPSQYAQDKGLFVLTPLENTTLFNSEVNKAPFSNGVTLSGEGMVVILNDEKFKPKEW